MRGIELFAGAGGLGIGVSRSGFTPVQVVEWDSWCCETIRENKNRGVFPISHWPEPTDLDIRKVDFRHFENTVELITGGPPCQPFSLGGKHRAYEDDRDMWPQAVRAVREAKPKAFIFENVKGLARQSFATYFAYIVHQLTYPEVVRRKDETWRDHLARLERHHTGSRSVNGLVYRVVPRLLNAANYGVPQRRERVVFVGFRADLGIKWSFPDETHSQDALLWEQTQTNSYWERHGVSSRMRQIAPRLRERGASLLFKPQNQPWRTVRDAIGDLPDPEREPRKSLQYFNHKFQPGARAYLGHTGSPLDEPAKTLKAGVHGVPGGENMIVRPDGSFRYFTVRESARLQNFPDEFVFHGAWGETMRQLGNAVPVRLAEIIASHVRTYLSATIREHIQ